ncbi:MAG: hypothetical protein P8Z36_07515 [Gemmatimonadota bacterium]
MTRQALLATLLLAGAASLSGCAAAFANRDLAPNGLPKPEEGLRRMLIGGNAAGAFKKVTGKDAVVPDDDLLRLLFAGALGHYAGRYDQSSQLLDVAAAVADDRVTRSISREALSFLSNDRVLPYTPSRTERLMLHYYAALDYLDMGEPGEAAVEARRIAALLDRWDGDAAPDDTPPMHRFFRYFSGVLFQAAGESNDAAVAFRHAPGYADTLSVPGADSGDVLVLIERGFVAHRVEQSVMIALPGRQLDRLTGGSLPEQLAEAGLVATYVLAIADASGYRTYYRDNGYLHPVHFDPWGADCRRAGVRCARDDDENPYLLRVAWPVYRSDRPPQDPVSIQLPDGNSVPVQRAMDVTAGELRDFSRERGSLLARTVVRAATKLALTKTVEKKVGDKNEVAGRILGILTNVGTLVTERADTRTWNVLPGSIEFVKVRLPAGRNTLVVQVDGALSPMGTVEVPAGGSVVTSYRLWR